MNDLTTFNFEHNEIRTIHKDGEPWFVLADLLRAMDSRSNPSNIKLSIIKCLGQEVVSEEPQKDAAGHTQNTTIINESATTYLIAQSRTETGKRLNRFIHIDVLPQIRKTGRYSKALTVEEQLLESAKAMVEQRRLLDEHEQRLIKLESTNSGDTGFWSIRAYCNVHKIRLPYTELAKRGRMATQLSKLNQAPITKVRDQLFGFVNGYHEDILAEVFKDRQTQ